MVDLRQTPQYARYMKALGWETVVTPLRSSVVRNRIYIKRILLIGNIAKLQRPQKLDFKQIKSLIETRKLSVLYIEPSAEISSKLAQVSFKEAKSAFLPSKTIHIDLTKSEEQLLKEMKPKTRYNIKIASKRRVVVRKSQDIAVFINLWKSSARRRLALPQSKEIRALWQAFGNRANLLLAYKEKNLIAGVLTARSPDTTFYMYAGSNKEGNKLFAPTLAAWEAIRLAKKLRCKTFDFEGIYDPRYSSTKSWRGFTKFKEGFGGNLVEFPKTLVYFKNPLLRFLNF